MVRLSHVLFSETATPVGIIFGRRNYEIRRKSSKHSVWSPHISVEGEQILCFSNIVAWDIKRNVSISKRFSNVGAKVFQIPVLDIETNRSVFNWKKNLVKRKTSCQAGNAIGKPWNKGANNLKWSADDRKGWNKQSKASKVPCINFVIKLIKFILLIYIFIIFIKEMHPFFAFIHMSSPSSEKLFLVAFLGGCPR